MIFIKDVTNGVLHCNGYGFAFCLIYRKESIIPRLIAMKLPPPSRIGKTIQKEGNKTIVTLSMSTFYNKGVKPLMGCNILRWGLNLQNVTT